VLEPATNPLADNGGGTSSRYERKGHPLEETINCILENDPRLRKKYKRSEASSDRLFKAQITHDSPCTTGCGDNLLNLILRPERTEGEDNPAIHYGLIASANPVTEGRFCSGQARSGKGCTVF